MPVCAPDVPSKPTDFFAFSSADHATSRALDNVMTLWTAPWRAWWALTFETLDAANWRAGR